ncbi:glycosyltransferase family 2 protein [Acidocella sp. MX-AZ03]|uniref:glycosyltransferase family 2 protein n=1 Tax=Acidocella sp. MX-AZ03 TaxID=2697363 RepID=UPI0022DE2DF0|nr:glycosyltransferase family 2 protein [Acidocella sp. MX-AZ03]
MIPLISLVVPCYNESEAIAPFAATIIPLLEAIPETQWEIICVDDGSKDDTLAQLIALAQRDPRVRVIELSRNFGKEAAMTAGLDAARGDAVIPFDADMQDPPELIPEMLAAWRAGAEVVLARRVDRSTDSAMKRQTALAFYKLHNALSHTKIPENVGISG